MDWDDVHARPSQSHQPSKSRVQGRFQKSPGCTHLNGSGSDSNSACEHGGVVFSLFFMVPAGQCGSAVVREVVQCVWLEGVLSGMVRYRYSSRYSRYYVGTVYLLKTCAVEGRTLAGRGQHERCWIFVGVRRRQRGRERQRRWAAVAGSPGPKQVVFGRSLR